MIKNFNLFIVLLFSLSLLIQPSYATNLTLDNQTLTLYGEQTYTNVTLINGSILYVSAYNGTVPTGTLTLDVKNLYVDNTSSINGYARGYRGGAGGYWNGAYQVGSLGGELQGFGGGYNGGSGGAGPGSYGTGNSIQGTDNRTDIQMGNGAGGGQYYKTAGAPNNPNNLRGHPGGALLIIENAVNVTIHGILNFAGGPGGPGVNNGFGGGGSSGGGIKIISDNINVSNSIITVAGGAGGIGQQANGVSGGLGRIKLFYLTSLDTTGATITDVSYNAQQITTISPPTNLTSSISTTHVNYTWAYEANTTSFNVSYNGVWTNGSLTPSYTGDITNTSNSYGNITVYSYNSDWDILSTPISSNNQALILTYNPLANYSTISITTTQNYTTISNYPINTSWYIDNILQQTNNSQNISNFSYTNISYGTYVIKSSSSYSNEININKTWSLLVYDPTPVIPSNITNTITSNTVYWTWNASTNPGDIFRFYIDGIYQFTSTNNTYNHTISPHTYSNISISSLNIHSNQYSSFVSASQKLPNRAPSISITNYTDNVGKWANFTLQVVDLDNDKIITKISNSPTNSSYNTTSKEFSWRPYNHENGTYNVTFEASDLYGGSDSKNMTFTITYGGIININSYSNTKTSNSSLDISTYQNELITYSVATNRISSVKFWKDDILLQNEYDNNLYTTNFTSIGNHTIKAQAYEDVGSGNIITWNVTVSEPLITNINKILASGTNIHWNWTNPTHLNINTVDIFINNISASTSLRTSYIAQSLTPSTSNTISIRITDTFGNVYNFTNDTQSTIALTNATTSTNLSYNSSIISPLLQQYTKLNYTYNSTSAPLKYANLTIYDENNITVKSYSNSYDFISSNKNISSNLIWNGEATNRYIVPNGYYTYIYNIIDWDSTTTNLEGTGFITIDSSDPVLIMPVDRYNLYRVFNARTNYETVDPIRINLKSNLGTFVSSSSSVVLFKNPITNDTYLNDLAIKKIAYIQPSAGVHTIGVSKDFYSDMWIWVNGTLVYNSNANLLSSSMYFDGTKVPIYIYYVREQDTGAMYFTPLIDGVPMSYELVVDDTDTFVTLSSFDTESSISSIIYSLESPLNITNFTLYTTPINISLPNLTLTVCTADIPGNTACFVTNNPSELIPIGGYPEDNFSNEYLFDTDTANESLESPSTELLPVPSEQGSTNFINLLGIEGVEGVNRAGLCFVDSSRYSSGYCGTGAGGTWQGGEPGISRWVYIYFEQNTYKFTEGSYLEDGNIPYTASPSRTLTLKVVSKNWNKPLGRVAIYGPGGTTAVMNTDISICDTDRTISNDMQISSLSYSVKKFTCNIENDELQYGKYTAVLSGSNNLQTSGESNYHLDYANEIWSSTATMVLPNTEIVLENNPINLGEDIASLEYIYHWNARPYEIGYRIPPSSTIYTYNIRDGLYITDVSVLLYSPYDPYTNTPPQIISNEYLGRINRIGYTGLDLRYTTKVYEDLVGNYKVVLYSPQLGGTFHSETQQVNYGDQISEEDYLDYRTLNPYRYNISTSLTKYKTSNYIAGSFVDWNSQISYYTIDGIKTIRPFLNQRTNIVDVYGDLSNGFTFNITALNSKVDTVKIKFNNLDTSESYKIYLDNNYIRTIANSDNFSQAFVNFSTHTLDVLSSKITLSNFWNSVNGYNTNIKTSTKIIRFGITVEGTASNISWKLSQGSTLLTEQNTSSTIFEYPFSSEGIYTLTLQAFNGVGESSTIISTITIKNTEGGYILPILTRTFEDFDNSDTDILNSIKKLIEYVISPFSYLWDFLIILLILIIIAQILDRKVTPSKYMFFTITFFIALRILKISLIN